MTDLVVNDKKMLVGQDGDQQSFWIDGNNQHCSSDFMSTTEITIQNGNVVSSQCGVSSSGELRMWSKGRQVVYQFKLELYEDVIQWL